MSFPGKKYISDSPMPVNHINSGIEKRKRKVPTPEAKWVYIIYE